MARSYRPAQQVIIEEFDSHVHTHITELVGPPAPDDSREVQAQLRVQSRQLNHANQENERLMAELQQCRAANKYYEGMLLQRNGGTERPPHSPSGGSAAPLTAMRSAVRERSVQLHRLRHNLWDALHTQYRRWQLLAADDGVYTPPPPATSFRSPPEWRDDNEAMTLDGALLRLDEEIAGIAALQGALHDVFLLGDHQCAEYNRGYSQQRTLQSVRIRKLEQHIKELEQRPRLGSGGVPRHGTQPVPSDWEKDKQRLQEDLTATQDQLHQQQQRAVRLHTMLQQELEEHSTALRQLSGHYEARHLQMQQRVEEGNSKIQWLEKALEDAQTASKRQQEKYDARVGAIASQYQLLEDEFEPLRPPPSTGSVSSRSADEKPAAKNAPPSSGDPTVIIRHYKNIVQRLERRSTHLSQQNQRLEAEKVADQQRYSHLDEELKLLRKADEGKRRPSSSSVRSGSKPVSVAERNKVAELERQNAALQQKVQRQGTTPDEEATQQQGQLQRQLDKCNRRLAASEQLLEQVTNQRDRWQSEYDDLLEYLVAMDGGGDSDVPHEPDLAAAAAWRQHLATRRPSNPDPPPLPSSSSPESTSDVPVVTGGDPRAELHHMAQDLLRHQQGAARDDIKEVEREAFLCLHSYFYEQLREVHRLSDALLATQRQGDTLHHLAVNDPDVGRLYRRALTLQGRQHGLELLAEDEGDRVLQGALEEVERQRQVGHLVHELETAQIRGDELQTLAVQEGENVIRQALLQQQTECFDALCGLAVDNEARLIRWYVDQAAHSVLQDTNHRVAFFRDEEVGRDQIRYEEWNELAPLVMAHQQDVVGGERRQLGQYVRGLEPVVLEEVSARETIREEEWTDFLRHARENQVAQRLQDTIHTESVVRDAMQQVQQMGFLALCEVGWAEEFRLIREHLAEEQRIVLRVNHRCLSLMEDENYQRDRIHREAWEDWSDLLAFHTASLLDAETQALHQAIQHVNDRGYLLEQEAWARDGFRQQEWVEFMNIREQLAIPLGEMIGSLRDALKRSTDNEQRLSRELMSMEAEAGGETIGRLERDELIWLHSYHHEKVRDVVVRIADASVATQCQQMTSLLDGEQVIRSALLLQETEAFDSLRIAADDTRVHLLRWKEAQDHNDALQRHHRTNGLLEEEEFLRDRLRRAERDALHDLLTGHNAAVMDGERRVLEQRMWRVQEMLHHVRRQESLGQEEAANREVVRQEEWMNWVTLYQDGWRCGDNQLLLPTGIEPPRRRPTMNTVFHDEETARELLRRDEWEEMTEMYSFHVNALVDGERGRLSHQLRRAEGMMPHHHSSPPHPTSRPPRRDEGVVVPFHREGITSNFVHPGSDEPGGRITRFSPSNSGVHSPSMTRPGSSPHDRGGVHSPSNSSLPRPNSPPHYRPSVESSPTYSGNRLIAGSPRHNIYPSDTSTRSDEFHYYPRPGIRGGGSPGSLSQSSTTTNRAASPPRVLIEEPTQVDSIPRTTTTSRRSPSFGGTEDTPLGEWSRMSPLDWNFNKMSADELGRFRRLLAETEGMMSSRQAGNPPRRGSNRRSHNSTPNSSTGGGVGGGGPTSHTPTCLGDLDAANEALKTATHTIHALHTELHLKQSSGLPSSDLGVSSRSPRDRVPYSPTSDLDDWSYARDVRSLEAERSTSPTPRSYTSSIHIDEATTLQALPLSPHTSSSPSRYQRTPSSFTSMDPPGGGGGVSSLSQSTDPTVGPATSVYSFDSCVTQRGYMTSSSPAPPGPSDEGWHGTHHHHGTSSRFHRDGRDSTGTVSPHHHHEVTQGASPRRFQSLSDVQLPASPPPLSPSIGSHHMQISMYRKRTPSPHAYSDVS